MVIPSGIGSPPWIAVVTKPLCESKVKTPEENSEWCASRWWFKQWPDDLYTAISDDLTFRRGQLSTLGQNPLGRPEPASRNTAFLARVRRSIRISFYQMPFSQAEMDDHRLNGSTVARAS